VDFSRIASQVASLNVEAARKKTRSKKKAPKVSKPAKSKSKSVLAPPTEWACRMELSVEVEFEGETSKAALVKKLKSEVSAMLESAVKVTARDLKLKPSDVRVRPTAFDCVVASSDYDARDGGDHDYDD
jgi:hypothetical protein